MIRRKNKKKCENDDYMSMEECKENDSEEKECDNSVSDRVSKSSSVEMDDDSSSSMDYSDSNSGGGKRVYHLD